MSSEDGTNSSTAKTFGERWNEMFQRLVKFKEKNGHCLVPNRYPEDKKLGAWVSAQRRHYKILTSGKKESTPMTLDRAQKLIDIGFDWSTTDPRHVSWDDRFEQLRQFKIKYGHVQVPMGWNENSSLSNWVSAQRQDRKLYDKGRPSRLTADKIARLDSLGFVWEAQRGGRRRKLKPLQESETKDGAGPPAASEEASQGRSDPPGERASRPSTEKESQDTARIGRPQSIPSTSLVGSASALSQQALLRAGAVAGRNPFLDSQQLLTPLQQRHMLSQLGSFPPSMAGGLLGGPSPVGVRAETLIRLQQQEQRDRAALAATIAARESLVGLSGIPGLPFGASTMGSSMFGGFGLGTRIPGRTLPGSTLTPSHDYLTAERKRSFHGKSMSINEMFDPSLPDPPQDQVPKKRAKTGDARD